MPRARAACSPPGQEIYIHSTQLRDHPRRRGPSVTVYFCTTVSDAEAARAHPNLDHIQAEEIDHRQLGRDLRVALTTDRSVAEYWAWIAAENDRLNDPAAESTGVVLALNGERLLEREYDLREVYQENGHDWQNEIACWNDIISSTVM
jgi:hypothetical protein